MIYAQSKKFHFKHKETTNEGSEACFSKFGMIFVYSVYKDFIRIK